jgi:uracil-DNA glycosylase
MTDPDLRRELFEVVAGLRAHLEARSRLGLLGVPAAPSPRLRAASVPETLPRVLAPPPAAPPFVPAAAPEPRRLPVVVAPEPLPALGGEDEPGTLSTGAHGLALVRERIGDCQRCKLCAGRKSIVFGVGNPEADLVFVGEAPGADEDAQGEPFVGKAGQLLTKMIEAMGFGREDVYICNVIKCRPPGNRNPEPDEVAACEPFLKQQLAALRPRMLVALGKFAAQSLCREVMPISRLRGSFRRYEGIQVMPTFHPAYLLRDPSRKREAWSDLQQVIAALRRMGIEPPRPPKAG